MQAAIVLLLPRAFHLHAVSDEDQAIRPCVHAAEVREGHSGHFHVIVPEAQQVEIASSPKRRIRPCSKQHRPFKHEAVTRCCSGKAIQQPFDAVADEQALEILTGGPRLVEQALTHRRRHVAFLRRLRHEMLSR